LGFIFFAGFLISTYRRQQAIYDRLGGHFNFGLALLCSFVALMVMGLFLHLQITKYLWLVFAMTRAMDDQSDGQQETLSVVTPEELKGSNY
jgi:hypothetical protein